MRVRGSAVATAMVIAVGASAPAGQAAALSVGSGCYRDRAPTTVAATGFGAGQPITVAGRGVGLAATVDAGGNAAFAGPAPNLVTAPPRATEPIELRATDGIFEAFARYEVTNVSLAVSPTTSTASRKVRWRPTGFPAGGTVYAHYVRRGVARRTSPLGPMPDRCAYLERRISLIPGRRPALGRWTVQLDTSATHDPATPGALTRSVIVRRR